MEDQRRRIADDNYRAIGRYVVEFSRLIFHMRSLFADRLEASPPILGELALAEASAYQIANAFFGMCRLETKLDRAEAHVAKRLRSLVQEEIEMRNYVAHGDWWVDLGRLKLAPLETSQLLRVKPMRSEGVLESLYLTAAQLDARSDSLSGLRDLVAEYGMICLGVREYQGMRVRDVLVLRDGAVVREGPQAPSSFRAV